MGGSFLITLREGLEAGLIVAIILAYLRSTNQRRHFRTVLVAALAAVAVSLVVGAAIFGIAGEFELNYGPWALKGADTVVVSVTGFASRCDGQVFQFTFAALGHLLWNGPGWVQHTFPAPSVETNICWQ